MNIVLSHGLFGTKHRIILVVCLLLIVLGFIFSKKLSFEKIIKVMLGVGIVSEVIKVFYYIIANEATHGGYLPKTDLPFHLYKRFPSILCFSHVLCTNGKSSSNV